MADAPVTTTIEDGVAVLRFDDGKVNVLSYAALEALTEGFDQASKDASAICIAGREGVFSAGFDLSIMRSGIDAAVALASTGGQLMLRLCLHPQPVVAAVTGHALAAGVLLAAACDVRIGADVGNAKIGLNETAIGMSLPAFAIELARDRLTPRALTAATVGAQLYDPHGAVEAGWLDEVVPAEECVGRAIAEARRLGQYSPAAYAQTKKMLREPLVERTRAAMARDDFRVG
jgi:enoyl-CoA hydratase